MSSTISILRGVLRQTKDQISWVIGENPVVFQEPYVSASTYVADVDAPDAVVSIKPGSRTATGFIVLSDAETDEGFYQVEGPTDDFNQGLGEAEEDVIGTTDGGKLEAIVNTTNTDINWDVPFVNEVDDTDDNPVPRYSFIVEQARVDGNDYDETIYIVSKSLDKVVVKSSSDNTRVKFRAID